MLGMGWLLTMSQPGGPEHGPSCRSSSLLHSNTGAADTWVLHTLDRQSPETCCWGRCSQLLGGDRCQQPAVSSAVSSHHLCFKASCASASLGCPLVGSSQQRSGAPQCCLWLEVGPLCLLQEMRLLPLLLVLLVLAARLLMVIAKPILVSSPFSLGLKDCQLLVAPGSSSPAGHIPGKHTLLQQVLWSMAGEHLATLVRLWPQGAGRQNCCAKPPGYISGRASTAGQPLGAGQCLEQARSPAAAAGQKASSEPLHSRAKLPPQARSPWSVQ